MKIRVTRAVSAVFVVVCLSLILATIVSFRVRATPPGAPECGDILADVVIMLDRTGSISESERLAEAAAAKSLLDGFTASGALHSVAVGAFPGSSSSHEAIILTGGGLTTDYAALKTVIDNQFTAVSSTGTNIASALSLAQTTLDGGANALKYIVLLSDGQANRTIGMSPSVPRDAAAGSAEALAIATSNKIAGTIIITIAYDATGSGSTTANGRTLMANMASNASDDDTGSDAVTAAEATQENADGDMFYIAPDSATLLTIFASVGGTIGCDDGDACTIDSCNSTTDTCEYTSVDFDSDGTPDCTDSCPNDPDKVAPGECGCDEQDTDSDGDGTADCNDSCPDDASKIIPGTCGCGVADTDTDGDGAADCQEQCDDDEDKTAPGICGCGVDDIDADEDGTYDCDDACPVSSIKTTPGVCGCDTPDTDSDQDGSADCNDGCDDDAGKTEPGQCGCGEEDTDSDLDGTADCNDLCVNDPDKTTPGECGCGESDADTDGDGVVNCNDQCPEDAGKVVPGTCGCGVADTDGDGDDVATCIDECPENPSKALPGQCGCAGPDTDSDGDGTADCSDSCAYDESKLLPGVCGCGVSDVDSDADGTADCLDNCPADAAKTETGICGCGVDDVDSDLDGTFACLDECPNDAAKTEAGQCGCGVEDTDSDGDSVANCDDNDPEPTPPEENPIPDTNPNPPVEDDDDTQTDLGTSTDTEVETPTTQVSVVTCDLTTDTNADGLPDVLDAVLTDNDADGVPDCCTNGNGSDALTSADTDGDGLPNCREFALGTNPVVNDVTFQGSGTTLSFGKCSLNTRSVPGSAKDDGDRSLFLVALTGLVLLGWRSGRRRQLLRSLAGLLAVCIVSGLLTTSAFAFDVQAQRAPDGTGKGYRLSTSATLPQGEISLGLHANYVHHPLELGIINNDPRLFGVVDRFVTTNLATTIGFHDRLNVSIDMPFNIYHDIAPTLIPTRDTGYGDVGDLKVSAKVKFLDVKKNKAKVGLALVPFMTAPTGDSNIFFGESGFTGGGVIAADKVFGERHRLFLNVGGKFRKRETLGNLIINHQLLYGVGYQLTASEKYAIDVIGEVQGSTTFKKIYNDEITTPIEGHAVLQKGWGKKRKLLTYVGAGAGVSNGYSAPDFRVTSGLAWSFNVKKQKAAPKPEMISEIVYFPTDKDRFYPVHMQQIEKVAAFYNKHQSSRFLVAGHTDGQGSDKYNENLSMRRAATVKKALVAKGIPADNISLEYRGETQPIDSNETAEGRQRNRRVTIEITVVAE